MSAKHFASARAKLVAAAVAVFLVIGGIAWYRSSRICCAPAPLWDIPAPEQVDAVPAKRPGDFSLDYKAQTGTVAPRYFHRYRLRINRNGAATLTFSPGYGPDGPAWTSRFVVSAHTLDLLWTELRVRGLWLLPPERQATDAELRVGGGSESLEVFAAGRTVVLSVDRRDRFAGAITDYIGRVRGLVPDSLLREFRARQEALPDP
jgi:hypothetical protein